jgi:taurine transport system permease protein
MTNTNVKSTLGETAARAADGKKAGSRLSARLRRRLLMLFSFAVMLFAWIGLSGSGLWPPIADPVFLPSPFTVIEGFFRLMENGYQGESVGHHVMISLFRFSIAFAFCITIGTAVGLIMGMSETVQALLDPPIEITRPIPKLAVLPLLIIWFGIGEVPKVIVIIFTLFPMMTISSMQAVKSVSKSKIQAAYSLGANKRIIFTWVVLPASLPGIFTGIRVSLGVGVTMLVAAEMIATSDGIAWMALSAADFLLTDVVLVGVIILAVLGYGLEQLARLIENRVVHWSGKEA